VNVVNQTTLNPLGRPTGAVMPFVPQIVMIAIFGIVAAAFMVWATRQAFGKGDHRPLILFGAGITAVLLEGFACFLMQCYHSPVGQYTVYSAFDVDVPLWLAEVYILFFGMTVFLMVERFSRPFSLVTFWGIFALIGIAEAAFEMYGIHVGMFRYYGAQPLPLLGFPFYLAFVNGAQAVIFTAVVALWFRFTQGAIRYLLIPLTPIFLWGVYAALVTPFAAGLRSAVPDFAVAGSLVATAEALALSSLAFWTLKRLQASR